MYPYATHTHTHTHTHRWVEMDAEMSHVWRLLTIEARRKPAPDLDKFTELALSFYFYYVNFGPLSRGTAATGYIAFFALMLSIGYEVSNIPQCVGF